MIKKFAMPAATLLFVTLVFGCGGKNETAGPATPGDPAALVSTSWSDSATNTVYAFKDASTVELTNPQVPTPMRGSYTVLDGKIDMTIGFQSISATWDGNVVAIKGKALVKQ